MSEKKIYVLDTSVVLHDHNSIKSFEENDVAIPITVLEELDNFKKGNDIKNFEAREFIRFLDKLSHQNDSLQHWIKMDRGRFKIIHHKENVISTNEVFQEHIADHQILSAALSLQKKNTKTKVILVTKDINLRLKAKALSLNSQDYKTGKISDVKELFTGKTKLNNIDHEELKQLFKEGYLDEPSFLKKVQKNHFYILKNGSASGLAYYNPFDMRLEKVEKQYVCGVKPKNSEQTFAISALLNPNIKLVALQGVAGTGKTLLALASALEQKKRYKQIVLARPIVPLSNRDLGFLPGDAQEKMSPYMQPLFDNMKFIKNQYSENDRKYKQIEDMEKNGKIIITALAYIRGRSLSDVFFIVDEAQNLTPHEIKTIITRAGENTKIVFTGDINQIDSPYLDEQSNGLTYLTDRLKNHELFAHVKLEKGERSALANVANELL